MVTSSAVRARLTEDPMATITTLDTDTGIAFVHMTRQ
jgi:hypothetical protein